MAADLAEHRRRIAISWVVAAIAAIAIAAATFAISLRAAQPDRVVGPVAPDLAQRIGEAEKINVASASASYRIARTQRGWAMSDRGDFPVLASRLAQLTDGLENLQFVRRMTSDPARHDRLGVGDPTQGGGGVLVQVENAQGAFLVNLIFGIEREGLYVRRPGEDQVWSVQGELPPLRDPAAWLDLQPIALDAATIRRAEIVPSQGRPYILERAAPQSDFAFAGLLAGRRALSAAALTDVAERIAQLNPIDVLPAPAVQGAAAARVRLITTAGVLIDAELVPSEEKLWLKLVARAERPEAQNAVDTINARASAWAYALNRTEAAALAPPLDTLLVNPIDNPAPAPAPPQPAEPVAQE